MHSRRGAWIASHRDTETPLLQQGQLMLASGRQDGGEAGAGECIVGFGPARACDVTGLGWQLRHARGSRRAVASHLLDHCLLQERAVACGRSLRQTAGLGSG